MALPTLYMSPITLILQQVFTNYGIMAAGGQVQVNFAGGSAPATTYTDSTGSVPNPNPLTLNSAGRATSASGALVAFWAPSGDNLQLTVTDAQGNLLLFLDWIPNINDPVNETTLAVLLSSPASSNAGGTGPVAGADLVANAVKSYDTFADVRLANVPILASGQTLIIETEGALAVGDSLGGPFYWSASSTAADDGATVLKPQSLTGPGRYLRIVLPASAVSLFKQDFSGELTDGVNSIAIEVAYSISGEAATLRVDSTLFTSGADVLTLTGLPSALFPTIDLILPTFVTDNGVSSLLGAVQITAVGTVTFYISNSTGVSGKIANSSTGFTTSGSKGLQDWSLTYPLN